MVISAGFKNYQENVSKTEIENLLKEAQDTQQNILNGK